MLHAGFSMLARWLLAIDYSTLNVLTVQSPRSVGHVGGVAMGGSERRPVPSLPDHTVGRADLKRWADDEM